MKTLGVVVAATALLLLGAGALKAEAPALEDGVLIQDGGGPLYVDGYSTVTTVDWNNDGKKDLLVGQYTNGYVWLYINVGTDSDPVFNGGVRVESGGFPITTPYD